MNEKIKCIAKGIMIFTSLFSALVYAANPKDEIVINYSGTVVIPPCIIATPAITVDFGDIQANDLATADSATDWKEAAVKLTDCNNVNSVDITVSAVQDSADMQYVANSGTAEHVGVEATMTFSGNVPIYNGILITRYLSGQPNLITILNFRIHNDGTGAATTGTVLSTMTLTYSFK